MAEKRTLTMFQRLLVRRVAAYLVDKRHTYITAVNDNDTIAALSTILLKDFLDWIGVHDEIEKSMVIDHNKGLIAARKGELTLEFSTEMGKMPVGTVGRWVFQLTQDEQFVSKPMTLNEALPFVEEYMHDNGYIFMRIQGLATDERNIGSYATRKE